MRTWRWFGWFRRAPAPEVVEFDIDLRALREQFIKAIRANAQMPTLSEFMKLDPRIQTAMASAGTAVRAEQACAIARAMSSAEGFAEVMGHVDGGTMSEVLLCEDALVTAAKRFLRNPAPGDGIHAQ